MADPGANGVTGGKATGGNGARSREPGDGGGAVRGTTPDGTGPREAGSGEAGPGERGAGETDPGEIRYSREMGLTDDDFFRILPKAMGAHPYRVEGRTVHGEVHEGRVEIVLGPPQERRIALLRLPFAEVSFTFRGVTEPQQQAFKRHFDLYFQRGGG